MNDDEFEIDDNEIDHENIREILDDLGISQDDFDYDVISGPGWE